MPHDLKLWCEDCQKGYEGECEEHGPLTHVSDKEVGTRARRSLPHLLELKEGKIRTGVFAKQKLAKRLQFGPLQGVCEKEPRRQILVEEEIRNRYGIVYKLVQQNDDLFLLDTRFEEHSNWMIFVRPAERKSEQNLVAFQYKGEIFFATIKEIPAQCELKVWFSKDYAERMGTRILSDDGSSWQFRTRQRFNCLGCGVVFSSAGSLSNHRCSKVKHKTKSEGLPTSPRKKIKLKSSVSEEVPSPKASTSGDVKSSDPEERGEPQLTFAKKFPPKLKERKTTLKGKSRTRTSESSDSEEELKIQEKGVFQCSVCEKVFNSPGKLKQHSYSHTGERPFSCPFCQKAFSSRFKLGRHQLIHTGERQHRCHLCDRSFHRKDHLKNHIQIHDPNKQFKCERPDCGKEYNSLMSYRKHCAVHAAEEGDLECKICLEMFEKKSDLIYHLKVHVGTRTVKSPSEKKFPCDQCDRRFFTRKDVKRHLVVHTGKRDFVCSLCPQKFGRKDHLVRHVKKSHGVVDFSRLEQSDPHSIPGPSTAGHALSPEATALSSTSASSGDQSFSSLLLGDPLQGPMASTSKFTASSLSQPTVGTYSTGSFTPEFRFFEEGIKEEPELTASVESIGTGGDDISKILGMYLPTGSINLPVQSLLETPGPHLQGSHEEALSGETIEPLSIGQADPESLSPLLMRGGTMFEEETPLPASHLLPVSRTSAEFSQVCHLPSVSLMGSDAPTVQVPPAHTSTLLTHGFRSLLGEEASTSMKETSQSSESTSVTTTTTSTTSTSSLPGFEQAFP